MTSRDDPGEPLDLGVVGSAAEPDPPGGPGRPGDDSADHTAKGHARWRRWGALAAAAVAGVAGGLVIAQARDDAAGYSSIELVGGPMESVSFDAGRPRGELTVALLNTGGRAVQILGIEVDGVTLARGAAPGDPVTAEPGRWVRFVQRDIEVDCGGEVPGAVHVRARTESGAEQRVEIEPPDDYNGLRGFWFYQCQAYQFGLQVRDSTLMEAGGDITVLALELANDGPDDLRVGSIASRAPGFVLSTDAADLSIPVGESITVTTTWTVRDCDAALSAAGAALAVRILTGDAETEQIVELPPSSFAPLARLSGQACPATIQE
jgi:hypothetical protein